MKREFFIHFAFWFSFFVLISVFKNSLSLSYWPFWVGGIIGTVLPDIDHLIYAFFMDPQELTSQRAVYLLRKRNILRMISLLFETRHDRGNLVFHTFISQIFFLVLSFLILSSSSSLLAIGIVLGFSIHLSVDQLADITGIKNLDNWGNLIPFEFRKKYSPLYVFASFIVIFLMGILI